MIFPENIGSSTPDVHDEANNRIIAAKAALKGSWFNWYGRFGGTGDMINFNNPDELPPFLQLIRVIPNWDNLCSIPLKNRIWKSNIYKSPNSFMDKNIIYSRHPFTQKLFVVFLNKKGFIKLKDGESVLSVKKADKYFREDNDAISELKIENKEIHIK